jgi:phytoene dehydrogenase-like protein
VHLLREGKIPPPTLERRIPVVIVGAGVAGLSAGWKLNKAGFQEFEILELEPEVGGNARYGENPVSSYPWGAHYVPLPTRESRAVRELFEEIGVIEGYASSGEPIRKHLAFSPQERLYTVAGGRAAAHGRRESEGPGSVRSFKEIVVSKPERSGWPKGLCHPDGAEEIRTCWLWTRSLPRLLMEEWL